MGYGYGYGYYFDPTYILLIIGVLLSLAASAKLKSTFAYYRRVRSASGLTGEEAARRILMAAGITDVQVRAISGSLTDHYDPRNKTVNLSQDIYGQTSLAAVGVAAHECGHAIQHAVNYGPLEVRSALVPAANLIVSGILLLGILKIFSGTVVFRDRVKYLELNDTENQVLVKYREEDRSEYFLCVHTAYFCERIANKLELDRDALKCAGLYHRKGWDLMQETPDMEFPAGASEILEEYKGTRKYKKAETAVLYCSDAVVSAILLLLQKEPEKKPDYEQVIDRIFERIREKGIFSECDLSLRGWNRMQKIFKEEKLYYDFLR